MGLSCSMVQKAQKCNLGYIHWATGHMTMQSDHLGRFFIAISGVNTYDRRNCVSVFPLCLN
jgi:hypothetical protein